MAEFSRYDIRVAYHHTDAMGVVHHSNHVKYFEDARIDYLRQKNMMWHNREHDPLVFAVGALTVKYLKTAKFDDELQVWTQGRSEGARVHFQYAIFSKSLKSFIALGTSELIALGGDLKPRRIPKDLIEAFKAQAWDEVWPPALL